MKRFLIVIICLMLNGCASYEQKMYTEAVSSDEVYLRKWFAKKGTTPEVLIGKSRAEVEAIIGKPKGRYSIPSDLYCEKQLQEKGRAPNACSNRTEEWQYNIPIYRYLLGNTGFNIDFFNDEAVILEGAFSIRLRKEGYKEIED